MEFWIIVVGKFPKINKFCENLKQFWWNGEEILLNFVENFFKKFRKILKR